MNGKHLILAGGVTGIGRATALAAVSQGARAVSLSLQTPDPDAACILWAEAGEAVSYLQVDLADINQVKNAFGQAIDFLGGVDCMISTAGNEQVGPAETLTSGDFLSMYTVHVTGTANTNVTALKFMKENGGSIVTQHPTPA